MYKIICDGALLHDSRIDDIVVINPEINLEVNKTGSLTFTIYPDNGLYGSIQKLKSVIEVFQDGELLFRGRPLNDTTNFNKAVKITCEGDLGYLNDSILKPYEFRGKIKDYLNLVVDNHNSQVGVGKHFQVGKVTVDTATDIEFSRSNIEHTVSLVELMDKTIASSLGGYISLRRVDGVNYIDYSHDSMYINEQEIELTKNMLDFNKEVKADEIATVLIPLGAKLKDEDGNDTDTRLTISEINNGLDYITNLDAINKYGHIVTYKVFDDITVPQNLLKRAETELNFLVNLGVSISIKAVDLSLVDNKIPRFKLFSYVKIISKEHGIADLFLIKKQKISLDKPDQDTIDVGVDYSSFLDNQLETKNIIKKIKADYTTNEQLSKIVDNLTIQISEIKQTESEIKLSVENLKIYTDKKIDDIEVGARNLLLNSKEEREFEGYFPISYGVSKDLKEGQNLTFTIRADMAPDIEDFRINFEGVFHFEPELEYKGDGIYMVKFEVPEDIYAPILNCYFYRNPNINNKSYAYWVKLEHGNIATDWSPAPEDLIGRLDGIDVDLGDAITRVEQNEASISLTEDRISNEVLNREIQGDQIISETRSLIEQQSDSFQIIFNKIQNDQDLTDSEIKEITTYFRWDADGAIIGKAGHPVTMHQTNTGIEIRENNVVIAYWEKGTMHIDNLIANLTIVIGTHQVSKYFSPAIKDETTIIRKV